MPAHAVRAKTSSRAADASSESQPLARICPRPFPELTPPFRRFASKACTPAPTSAVGPAAHFRQESRFVPWVANLFRAPKRRLPMEELDRAELVSGLGMAGCT